MFGREGFGGPIGFLLLPITEGNLSPNFKPFVVEVDSVDDDVFSSGASSGLNPGGKNELTSSNFKESNNEGFDVVLVDFSVVFSVAFSLVFCWYSLGGFGLFDLFLLKSGKGPKSFGNKAFKSSCSMLDKIS